MPDGTNNNSKVVSRYWTNVSDERGTLQSVTQNEKAEQEYRKNPAWAENLPEKELLKERLAQSLIKALQLVHSRGETLLQKMEEYEFKLWQEPEEK